MSASVTTGEFAATRWSVVLAAGRGADPAAREALAVLCRTYWYPLYAYVRRRGLSPQDAEDRTQGFFLQLVRLNSLAEVAREKGRFRAFLLASMKHYLADARDREQAEKRGGGDPVLALDALTAETRYRLEPADGVSPERLYERQWALTLLGAAVERLRREHEATGQGARFMALRFAITGEKSAVPYAELAGTLGMSEEAVRVAVHRLRQRYRQVLREEIAQTVADPADVEAELADLRRALAP